MSPAKMLAGSGILLTLAALFGAAPLSSSAADGPPLTLHEVTARVAAVQRYLLEEDYPEKFGTQSYRMRVDNIIIADIDGDGVPEAIVQTYPHFRQSASIVVFKLDGQGTAFKASRVYEGLAPGPLMPVSGAYLDSHTNGDAFDFGVSGDVQAQFDAIVKSTRKKAAGNLVRYQDFMHMDSRTGKGSYIDMRHLKPSKGDKKCEAFEFARVTDMSTGPVRAGDARRFIVAVTGNTVSFYRINQIDADGFLDKSVWTMTKPADFVHFAPVDPAKPGEPLRYETTAGAQVSFRFEDARPLAGAAATAN